MPYPATVIQILLSSPSDQPPEHASIIRDAISTWNSTSGARKGVMFSPTDWLHGATPSYGQAPQDTLNEQIVDKSDTAIVVFTDRLGTKTSGHPSGTVEEIERMHAAGKKVCILVNKTDRKPVSGGDAAKEVLRLQEYLESIKNKSLYYEYSETVHLSQIINTILNELADNSGSFSSAMNSPKETGGLNNPAIGVWPSMKSEYYSETDSKGRLKNKTRSFLILNNKTGVPVTNVTYQYVDKNDDPAEGFDLRTEGQPTEVGTIPPDQEHRLPLWRSWQSGGDADCVVTWTAPDGSTHVTRSTMI